MGKPFRFDLGYNLKDRCLVDPSIDKCLTDYRKIYIFPRKLHYHDLHPGIHKFEFDGESGEFYVNVEDDLGVLRIDACNSIVLENGQKNKKLTAYQKIGELNSAVAILRDTGSDKLGAIMVIGSEAGTDEIKLSVSDTDAFCIYTKNIKLKDTLYNIDDKYIDYTVISGGKGYTIKSVGYSNIINTYNVSKTRVSNSEYSVFFVANDLVRYCEEPEFLCTKMDKYSYKELINKSNKIEGIAISNDCITRGHGFFIKLSTDRASSVQDLGDYLDSIGGIEVKYPLERRTKTVDYLHRSRVDTFQGGTIITNLTDAKLSYFYRSLS